MGHRSRPRRHNRVYHRARRRLVALIEAYQLDEQLDEEEPLVNAPVLRLITRFRH